MYMGRSLYIYIEHRNLETRKTFTTSLFRYETCYYFWVKGFDIRKRDTNSFNSSAYPQHLWYPPQKSPRASESQLSSPEAGLISTRPVSRLNWLTFFKISQNPPRASFAWRHSHLLASVSHLRLLWLLWETRPFCARARAWTPALMLHLSTPCTEPKGSRPNYIYISCHSNSVDIPDFLSSSFR